MTLRPPGYRRTHSLLDEGRRHLDAGRHAEAELCFRNAARACAIPAALNNWAMCRYLKGDWADTLQILSPLVSGPEPAPYARALAADPYGSGGRGDGT